MEMKSLIVILFLVYCITCVRGTSMEQDVELDSTKSLHSSKIMDLVKFSHFYDIKTNETIKKISPSGHKQLPFAPQPCSCENYKCACCTGIRIIGLNFDREVCGKMVYQPKTSVVDFELMLNNASLFRRTLSSENRQFCFPVLPITFMGPVDMCVRLMDITVTGQQMHACLNLLTRVSHNPIMNLQFNCVEMGPGGVGLSLPGITVPLNGTSTEISTPPQSDIDVFDPVAENGSNVTVSKTKNVGDAINA